MYAYCAGMGAYVFLDDAVDVGMSWFSCCMSGIGVRMMMGELPSLGRTYL